MSALNYVGVPTETSTMEPGFLTLVKDSPVQSGDFVHYVAGGEVAKADGSKPIIGVVCSNPDIDQNIYAYVMTKGRVYAVAPNPTGSFTVGQKLMPPQEVAPFHDGTGGIIIEIISSPADFYYPDSDLQVGSTDKVVKVEIGGQQ